MNQVTPKPAALKPALKRSNAPIFWLLFGGGGMLAALFGPVLVFITGIAVPSGFTLPVDLLSYDRVHALAQNFVGKGFLFAVIMLFAWHAAHRILCTLHDIGIHKGLAAKSACYGSALVVTVVAAGSLLKIGF
jgi:fumarate reductase subunit D